MKITDGTIWVDNSNLKAMGGDDFCGTSSLYYTDPSDKTSLLKTFSYDSEKSRTFPEVDIESYLEIDLELDYAFDDDNDEQLTCFEPYLCLIIRDKKIIKQQQVVETKISCTCQCGKTVFHTVKPIPLITEKD